MSDWCLDPFWTGNTILSPCQAGLNTFDTIHNNIYTCLYICYCSLLPFVVRFSCRQLLPLQITANIFIYIYIYTIIHCIPINIFQVTAGLAPQFFYVYL